MASKINYLRRFSVAFEGLGETKQNDFSRIVSRFLNETFILKECETDRRDYFFISENKEMFFDYFAIIDYDFIFDLENHCFYIKTLENRNRVRLNKFDTAVLLILRKMYYLKRKDVTTEDKVIITLDELIEQIRTTQIFNPDKKISAYAETLRKLRIHKIIFSKDK